MPNTASAPDWGRFIILAQDEGGDALSAFLHTLDGNPDINLINTIGPPGHPHTAVIETSSAQARLLEQRLPALPGGGLHIEPDHPLSLSAGAGI